MKCNYISEYPRPQFVRDAWVNLNGEWNFLFDDKNEGDKQKYFVNFLKGKTIKVPFTYETEMSGINDQSQHNVIWYNRKIKIDKDKLKNKVLLHFEGSDFITEVWINGNYVGKNIGGYFRFSFAIEKYLVEGENDLTVKVTDSLSKSQPRGKQRYKKESFKCWYIQTTGIWKTVWLEFVPKHYLVQVKNTPDYDQEKISLSVETNITMEEFMESQYELEIEIYFNNICVNRERKTLEQNNQEIVIPIHKDGSTTHKWDVLKPNLYEIKYVLLKNKNEIDVVNSYFGIRKIEIKGNKIYLNEKELYQKLILDQGYWKETHLTPLDDKALISDVDNIIRFGYNGVRKHQKNEDERFLYWCDQKGLLVWSEMANCYEFNDKAIAEFSKEWLKVIRQNYNHPSIITWVPVNESWGVPNIRDAKKEQDFVNHLYYLTKAIDETRPVVCNDGWEHTISDIITIHDYKQDSKELEKLYIDESDKVFVDNVNYNGEHSLMAGNYKYNGQPVVMSEYGGIALDSDKGWGYGKQVATEEELFLRFADLTETIKKIDYLSGYCYTQLTDVQQEINGLLDENHKDKFSKETVDKIIEINAKENE